MFCYQCQEAKSNLGCDKVGVCGKTNETSNLQDLLVYVTKGVSLCAEKALAKGKLQPEVSDFIAQALFKTITNANFKSDDIESDIRKGLELRDSLKKLAGISDTELHDAATWEGNSTLDFAKKALSVGVLSSENEDQRSLRELLTYGLKGMAAYLDHANKLGYNDETVGHFMIKGLASTTKELSVDEMVGMVLECGKYSVITMALLDKANTESFGNPELTKVTTRVGSNPGILVSGHDLKDMEELLQQTENMGVDIYSHSEMLPANYYPALKKYKHFVGNYGGAWHKQGDDFTTFNGPILMTTNCITPVKDAYKDRFFTTGQAGYPGTKHIADRKDGGSKDFSEIIKLAKSCAAPIQQEDVEIVGGFAHHQVMALADKVVAAVKDGAVKRFVVMAGCDGRQSGRSYFTEVAEKLPKDHIILTAGCAKYRYNKLNLGDIGGIPRVLDAGQCNDSYSLAVIALKLKEVFGLDDINDLPISYDIAWYEQKAVTVLLALLHLGVKNIRLGPSLPAFLSANVANVLTERFGIKPIGSVSDDIEAIAAGR